jgi:hypothetical protein
MRNLIDINQCDQLPSDPLVLKSIAVEAMSTARERRWPQLIKRLRSVDIPYPVADETR